MIKAYPFVIRIEFDGVKDETEAEKSVNVSDMISAVMLLKDQPQRKYKIKS